MIRKETGTNKKMEIVKMKNILSEMKLHLHEINSNLNTEKEKIIDLEDITMKNRGGKSIWSSDAFHFLYKGHTYYTEKNESKN